MLPVGNKFLAWSRIRATGSLVGAFVFAALAFLLGTRDLAGVAWAGVTAAAVSGWLLGEMPLGVSRFGAILRAGVTFGVCVSVGSLLLYAVAIMAAALLPGSTVSTPETPWGYLLTGVVVVGAMTPVLIIPVSLVGVVWAATVRQLGLRWAS